jgi:hypothetical protein
MPKRQNASQTNKTNAPASRHSTAGTKREKPPTVNDEQNNKTALLPATIGQNNGAALLQAKRGDAEDEAHSQKAEVETEHSVANIAKGCLPTSFKEIIFSIVIFASFGVAFLDFIETRGEMLVYFILLLVASYLDIKVVNLIPSVAKIAEVIHTFTSKGKSR